MLVKPLSILVPSAQAQNNIDQHVLDAKSSFATMRQKGAYLKLESQIIVYRITDEYRSHTGIVLGVDLGEFQSDVIVHHEKTIPSKVNKQAKVAQEQGGFSKPILLTNRPIPAITEIIDRYTVHDPAINIFLKKYKAAHQIWPITSANDIQSIQKEFQAKDFGYIVDGHHRTRAIELLAHDSSVSLSVGLCAMFDIDQLDILSFHRIVDINMLPDDFLVALAEVAHLTKLVEARNPESNDELILLINQESYSINWKNRPDDVIKALNVNVLSKQVINGILNIPKENKSPRVNYLEGNYPIEKIQSMISGTSKVAFLLYPLSRDQFIDTVNAGHLLPPKSTWFLPRMANGIVSMAWE